jgi:hypothetical protein
MWSPDCGQWLQFRQAKQSEMHEAYVVGLINGMSMGSGVSIWSKTGEPTKEQLFYWLDEYCRTNPLKDTSEAVAAFANQVTHDAYPARAHASSRHRLAAPRKIPIWAKVAATTGGCRLAVLQRPCHCLREQGKCEQATRSAHSNREDAGMALMDDWKSQAQGLIRTSRDIFATAVVPTTENARHKEQFTGLTLLARTVSNLKGRTGFRP